MSLTVSFWRDNAALTGITALVLASQMQERLSLMRHVRRWSWVLAGGVVLYRGREGSSSTSFLDDICVRVGTLVDSTWVCKVAGDILGMLVVKALVDGTTELSRYKLLGMRGDLMTYLYKAGSKLPFIQKELAKEKGKLRADLDRDLKSKGRAYGDSGARLELPATGLPVESIRKILRDAATAENAVWQAGKCSGSVYHGGKEHQALLNEAFALYSLSNPLHADIFPSLIKFEAEIVSMTASLLGGSTAAAEDGSLSERTVVRGGTTSGGTESIILAIKAHRDYYKAEFGITDPEMVCCVTAHAAVDKGCDMLGIRLKKVPSDPATHRIDLSALAAAVGPNTILLYASAPNFPQGTIDDIPGMAAIAKRYGTGLHVDCCLGGFVLPFMRKLGYAVPRFDFSVDGVTSMSVDTHKYGFALKGTSVVLYADAGIRQSQYFCFPDWTGGMYTTPTIAGSRSGGLVAQCWTSLVATGEEGYMKAVDGIVKTTRVIAKALQTDSLLSAHLQLLGAAEAMIVCFSSNTLNIYAISERMTALGWSLNTLQHPASIHLCVTRCHLGREEDFLQDLRTVVDDVALLTAAGKTAKVSGTAAIYGMTSGLPAGPVIELLREYNDCLLDINP